MGLADWTVVVLGILVSFLTIIEKWEKIKWRPLSWLFGNNRTDKKIDELTTQIKQMNDNIGAINDREYEHYKKQAKMFISDFAADLRKIPVEKYLKSKSKGQFCSIIDLCDEYLDKKWNSEVKHDAEFIKEVFNNLKDKI